METYHNTDTTGKTKNKNPKTKKKIKIKAKKHAMQNIDNSLSLWLVK